MTQTVAELRSCGEMKVELLASRFRILIDRLPAMIGRSSRADVRLHDPEVSRNHCQIEQLNGELLIRDVGSTNGTFVNGDRVAETALMSGDRVSLGQTDFSVLYEYDSSCARVPGETAGVTGLGDAMGRGGRVTHLSAAASCD